MSKKCEICEADIRILKSGSMPSEDATLPKLTIADLFAGCGGLSLGIQRAARDLGYSLDVRLAVDYDEVAIEVYRASFKNARIECKPIEEMFDGKSDSSPTDTESALQSEVGQLDILLGGPPCQGHSNLNNHSRRDDDRNGLYLYMARAAELLRPSAIIVENVPTVTSDVRESVKKTVERLEEVGYKSEQTVVDLWKLGVPQKRRRHVTIAALDHSIDLQAILDELKEPICEELPRGVGWAIGDLKDAIRPQLFDSPSQPQAHTRIRIDWLFENDEFDLPNEHRPECHQTEHSYTAMYGRMSWDAPAQTVTTGFNSMGQGRYVHPCRRRVITPHEAARLQMLPDYVDFGSVRTRKSLSTLIGNAVPPPLTFELGKRLIPYLKDEPTSPPGCHKSGD
ncbi:MAG: DNA cytosine methyltransferase [Chloroflexota bacterium]|nr:DNA cytosine methyltransferase [Chloroflexota bacterium]